LHTDILTKFHKKKKGGEKTREKREKWGGQTRGKNTTELLEDGKIKIKRNKNKNKEKYNRAIEP